MATACKAICILLMTVIMAKHCRGVAMMCMEGFSEFEESCYVMNDSVRSGWIEANDYCKSIKAHLPYIGSKAESSFLVYNLSSPVPPDGYIWLGLTVDTEDERHDLTWGDGTTVSDNFFEFQPEGETLCAVLRASDLMLELAVCSDELYMICEAAPGGIPTPGATVDASTLTPIGITGIANSSGDAVTDGATPGVRNTEPTECVTIACLKELIETDPADVEKLTTVIEVGTQMLEDDGDSSGTSQADRVTEIIEFLDETFSLVLENLDANRTAFAVSSKHIVFEAKLFSGSCGVIHTNSSEGLDNGFALCTDYDKGGLIGVGIACVPDSSIVFPLGDEDGEPDLPLGSCVITLNVVRRDVAPSATETMTNATMAIATNKADGVNDDPVCTFWQRGTNDTKGSWSEEGCHMVGRNTSHVICSCNHLTNFAVLVRIVPLKEPFSKKHTKVLDILSVVGGWLSIVCLSATLVIYIWLKVYRSQTLIIHANLAVSILISQVIFLTGINATEKQPACKLVAALLHYFLLASFAWMMLEGVNLYLKATSIFRTNIHIGVLFSVGWVTPLPIVGISLAVKFSSYTSEEYCWLNMENGLIWAFVAPIIVVILCNTCVLFNVIRVFLSLEAMADKSKTKRIKAGARAVLLLTPLLGITWLIGPFSLGGAALAVSYIFVILYSSQGVSIFILHCILNEEVGKAVQLKLDKHRKLRSSRVHPSTNLTSKGMSGSEPRIGSSEKRNVAWTRSPATDKTSLNSTTEK